jgi:hypothetical protein
MYDKIVEPDDDDDDEDDDQEEELDDDLNTSVITIPWMEKIGVFYSASILSEPLRKERLKKLLSFLIIILTL